MVKKNNKRCLDCIADNTVAPNNRKKKLIESLEKYEYTKFI